MKKKTVAKIAEDCAVLLQRIVRLKASDDNGYCSCVTCGKTDHFNNMQGGHFIERGRSASKIMEENIHPQCKGCNQWGMKKASTVLAYRQYMVDMYGEDFIKELETLHHKPHKWNRIELEDLHKELKQRLKEEESRF